MEKKTDSPESEDITLRSLTDKLHVGIPFSKAYVFNGAKGTFVIKSDRQRPIDRFTDNDE
jgi:hypothetical protein